MSEIERELWQEVDALTDLLLACRGQVDKKLRDRIDKHMKQPEGTVSIWDRTSGGGRRKTGMKLAVYVAGPLTTGDWVQNVRQALDAEAELTDAGYLPFVPHKSVLSDLVHHRSYEQWIEWCLDWVERCDVLVRLPGESPGADREVEHARLHGLPVVHGVRLDVLAGCAKARSVPPVDGPAKVIGNVLEAVCKDVAALQTGHAKLVLDKVGGNELDEIKHEIRLIWSVIENRPGVPADPPVSVASSSSAQAGGDPSLGTIVPPDCLSELEPADRELPPAEHGSWQVGC